MTLELVRGGFPPIIIRRVKDRDRYIEALGESDQCDLTPLFDLFADRLEDALRDLERAAQKSEGYDPVAKRIEKIQQGRVDLWNGAVRWLADQVAYELSEIAGDNESVEFNFIKYDSLDLSLTEYLDLCQGRTISSSWAFRINLQAAGLPSIDVGAFTGFQSREMRQELSAEGGPSMFLSLKDPKSPYGWRKLTVPGDEPVEISMNPGNAERLFMRTDMQSIQPFTFSRTARRLVEIVVGMFDDDEKDG